ncbi:hypothetical protein D3C72_2027970 [compost metagenome]
MHLVLFDARRHQEKVPRSRGVFVFGLVDQSVCIVLNLVELISSYVVLRPFQFDQEVLPMFLGWVRYDPSEKHIRPSCFTVTFRHATILPLFAEVLRNAIHHPR